MAYIRKYLLISIILIAIGALSACVYDDDFNKPSFENIDQVEGLIPIYLELSEAKTVRLENARALKNPGKIYTYQQYLFVNEVNEGIHIIDNADPISPQQIGFIKIMGNIDIAIKGNALYADNFDDLVAIDLTNVNDIKISKRIKGVYKLNTAVPGERDVYFECPEPEKGVVVGWRPAILKNPRCYR